MFRIFFFRVKGRGINYELLDGCKLVWKENKGVVNDRDILFRLGKVLFYFRIFWVFIYLININCVFIMCLGKFVSFSFKMNFKFSIFCYFYRNYLI